VTEDAPPRTTTGRGLLRLEAEGAWAAAAQQAGLGITLFRLGGGQDGRRRVGGLERVVEWDKRESRRESSGDRSRAGGLEGAW
jgi:hypothetical protein